MPALAPVTLGTGETDASYAVAINRSGEVAGTIESEAGVRRAVLYHHGKIELGTLGGSDSYAGGINAAGDVVGTAQNADGHWRAFVAPAAGAGIAPALRDLGTLGGRSSHATDINNHGLVVGAAALATGYRHAFLARPGAAMQDLGTLGGGSSAASAVNDSGAIVGTAETAGRRWHAFLWKEGKMTDLGALIGYGDSFATDINRAGHVAGSIRIGSERRAFVYRDGKMTVHPGGFGLYLVNAINDDELVIGAQYTGKQFSAAVMHADQPAVVTHGGQDLLGIIAGVLLAATTLVVCRRRYRGMAGLAPVTPRHRSR